MNPAVQIEILVYRLNDYDDRIERCYHSIVPNLLVVDANYLRMLLDNQQVIIGQLIEEANRL